jgi:SAM-dependent methyltransferase
MYPLSGGVEQAVFEGGARRARSSRLVERFSETADVPPHGRLLDIGCGNGAFLRAFATKYPGWELAGSEQVESFRDAVLGIPGVTRFYSGDLADIEERFDIVTGIHVVEHLTDPVTLFRTTKDLIKRGGKLFLQTPCFLDNPFDLMVADHCSHFRLATLSTLLELAGFEVVFRADDWVPKEIGVIGRPALGTDPVLMSGDAARVATALTERLEWLGHVAAQARILSRGARLGIFGTSIAGTWLGASLGDAVSFFVDEDPTRQGKSYLGRPVVNPQELRAGDRVYLAFPPIVAASLKTRLESAYPSVQFISPAAEGRG